MRILLLLILFCFPFRLAADTTTRAAKKPLPLAIKTDTAKLQSRNFSKTAIKSYQADKSFDYSSLDTPSRSLWSRFWAWFWGLFQSASRDMLPSGFFKYLFIVLGVGGLIFAILKLMGMDMMQILSGKSKTLEVPYEESLENIHQINFDAEIERAVQNKNYRLAVRLLYLNSLKRLNDAGIIHWQIDKTNAVYVSEIEHPDNQQQFRQLTHQFEYVWYGDFPVDGSSFKSINNSFHDFNQKIA